MAKTKEKQLKGAAGFDAYYAQLYGSRWQALRKALLQPPRYIAFEPEKYPAKEYFLDAGSVCAALMLPLEKNCRILDMCAAPGGKSLILASRMQVLDGVSLVCNELSQVRRKRLASVLDTYTASCLRNRVTVTGYDASKWCRYETEVFDRILLDAPCSSERHVLQEPKYLAQWSPSRIKHVSQTQWALLSSAFRLLKCGGYVLYATCALSVQENDAVVQKLLCKFTNVQLLFPEPPCVFNSFRLPDGEKTACGFHILPDVQEGAGPLYFSLIQKI